MTGDEFTARLQVQILDAYGLKPWHVGLAPAPRLVRWARPLRRAWHALTDRGQQ